MTGDQLEAKRSTGSARSPARRAFLQMLVAVAAVHGVAIASYYLLDISGSPVAHQRLYAWTWMAATVAAVVIGLQRLKRARRRGLNQPTLKP